MKGKRYTVIAISPEAEWPTGICFGDQPYPGRDGEQLPLCTTDIVEAEAVQTKMSREWPACEYVICELVPVSADLLGKGGNHG